MGVMGFMGWIGTGMWEQRVGWWGRVSDVRGAAQGGASCFLAPVLTTEGPPPFFLADSLLCAWLGGRMGGSCFEEFEGEAFVDS